MRDFPLAAVWISFQETELKPNPGTAQCLSCPAKFVFVWVCVCVCVGCCVCVGLCVCVWVNEVRLSKDKDQQVVKGERAGDELEESE